MGRDDSPIYRMRHDEKGSGGLTPRPGVAPALAQDVRGERSSVMRGERSSVMPISVIAARAGILRI